MILETKYDEGDSLWVVNPKTGKLVQREIVGIRTQMINRVQNTIYCFIKDWCLEKEEPTLEDCFWLDEGKLFDTKQELIASL